MLKEQIKALKRRVDELKGRASSAPLTAFDVDGTPVGAVVGIDRDNIPWVVMMAEDAASPPQSYTFALRVLRDEFQGAKVWYSLPDCMGTAYLEPRGGFIGGDLGPNSIAIAGVDYVRVPAIYYAAAAGADLIDVQVASTPLADGRCSNSPLGTELRRVVAATLVTLDTPSTAPYMVGPTSTSP